MPDLKAKHFIGPALAAVAFIAALWMMVQLDDYRVTNLEMQLLDLEKYVAAPRRPGAGYLATCGGPRGSAPPRM